MKILSIEFSSEERSVAVVENGAVLARVGREGGVLASSRSLGLVSEALARAAAEIESIEIVAIGIGPGSYTGIRGAIALAQGFELARGVRLLPVSSVDCIAERARSEGRRGSIYVAVDAQRNEFYLARYDLDSAPARETEPLRIAPIAEPESLLSAGATIIGPDLHPVLPKAQNVYPDAAVLGRLAEHRDNFLPGEKIEPIYLRQTTFKKSPPWRIL